MQPSDKPVKFTDPNRPTRKVWLYLPHLVEMSDLKAGNLFQMQKATPDDPISENDLLMALEDAKPMQDGPTTHGVLAGRMIPDENFGKEKSKVEVIRPLKL